MHASGELEVKHLLVGNIGNWFFNFTKWCVVSTTWFILIVELIRDFEFLEHENPESRLTVTSLSTHCIIVDMNLLSLYSVMWIWRQSSNSDSDYAGPYHFCILQSKIGHPFNQVHLECWIHFYCDEICAM